jgi:hypothetical protein
MALAAESLFIGKWKLDPSKPDEMKVQSEDETGRAEQPGRSWASTTRRDGPATSSRVSVPVHHE